MPPEFNESAERKPQREGSERRQTGARSELVGQRRHSRGSALVPSQILGHRLRTTRRRSKPLAHGREAGEPDLDVAITNQLEPKTRFIRT